jgi:hypothetical protein
MPPVVDQEFVAHLFAFEDGPQADLAYEQLRGMWTACGDELGMSVLIVELGVSDGLPPHRTQLPAGDVLAARQRAGAPDRQCVLRRVGVGVLAMSVMMVQPQPERTGVRRLRANGPRLGWKDFALLWSQATAGGTDALLGETVRCWPGPRRSEFHRRRTPRNWGRRWWTCCRRTRTASRTGGVPASRRPRASARGIPAAGIRPVRGSWWSSRRRPSTRS